MPDAFAYRRAMTKLFLCLTLAAFSHAATLYTFSSDGAAPYSFSFLEFAPLSNSGAFAIPPFQAGGLTFTQATLTQAGGTSCFQFGTSGASLTATPFTCGVTAFAPEGGWQSLFFGASGPGAYTAFNITSDGSAPAAPDLLSIQNVDAYEYTFSNTAANPYSFSFLELTPLTGPGAFPIAPFQVAGLTFTQATLSQVAGTDCFQFGTAGATLTAPPFTCGVTAFAPDGGWQSLFFGASGPGAYTAFNAASNGSAPAAPGVLTITTTPEPSTLALVLAGLALVSFLFHSSPRRVQPRLDFESRRRVAVRSKMPRPKNARGKAPGSGAARLASWLTVLVMNPLKP